MNVLLSTISSYKPGPLCTVWIQSSCRILFTSVFLNLHIWFLMCNILRSKFVWVHSAATEGVVHKYLCCVNIGYFWPPPPCRLFIKSSLRLPPLPLPRRPHTVQIFRGIPFSFAQLDTMFCFWHKETDYNCKETIGLVVNLQMEQTSDQSNDCNHK